MKHTSTNPGVVTGKLHILFNDSDLLFHLTDDPGRNTYLRVKLSTKLKESADMTRKEAITACLTDIVNECYRIKLFEIVCKSVCKTHEQEIEVKDIASRLTSSGIICEIPLHKQPIPTARTRKHKVKNGRRYEH